MTNRYLKITRAIPTSETTATHDARMFLGHWIVSYRIPEHLVTENGPQFMSAFFAILCGFLGLKHLTTAAYHTQTNG